MLRTLVERLSRGMVLRRRLPQAFGRGRFYVSPENGGLKYWRLNVGKADPELLALVQEQVKPGMNVWDVGANMGLLTFAAAHRSGPGGMVLAIEPDVDNLRLMFKTRRAMDAARNARVEVLAAAVADPGKRVAKFQIARRARTANALEGWGSTQTGGFIESRTVPILTLDELLDEFPPPGLIKIDVEGAELAVFAGATRMLREVRPVIAAEVSEHNSKAAAEIFKANRYRILDYSTPLEQRKDLELAPWNCLAVPQ
jgi:FkbM family methyltransferase